MVSDKQKQNQFTQSIQLMTQNGSKPRIHELSYATKVIQQISTDKQHIKLNESLFIAKVAAKQSSSLIKDLQKDVQTTIKKYDDFLKQSNIHKIQNSITSSPCRLKPQTIDDMHEEEQVLLSQMQNSNNSQRRQSMPIERSELRLSSFKVKEELFPAEDISPIKQQNNSNFNFRRKSTQILTQPPQQNTMLSEYYGSYAKLHSKKRPSAPQKEIVQQKLSIPSTPDIASRNKQWKERIQEKINSEQQRKSQVELKDCTFKPKLNENKKFSKSGIKLKNKSMSNIQMIQSKEMKEIMHIIDDLSQFNKQLKKH